MPFQIRSPHQDASLGGMLDLHLRTIEWKKKSLNDIKQVIALLKEADKNLKILCRTGKASVAGSDKSASQLAKEYARILDEDSEDYFTNAEAMDALEQITNANEEFEDTSVQVDEALDGLISALEEIKRAISEVKL